MKSARLSLTLASMIFLVTSTVTLASALPQAPPPIKRPMDLYEVTIQGASPVTVDYSRAYDTSSGEMIQNVMDTLVAFNGEHVDQYIGRIATNWTGPDGGLSGYFSAAPLNGGLGVDSGLPIAGLQFEHPANQTGANATYYYRYDFRIRQGIRFQPPYNYSLTPADVAYSFQRTIIQDAASGPQWMLQEPMLDNPGGDKNDPVNGFHGIANFSEPSQVAELGALIEHCVEYNDTDVWFNLMYPAPYAPFMQILTETWSAIESRQWILNQVIAGAGRNDWNGDWSNLTAWTTCWNPENSPLDTPTPMMYGSGPFQLVTLDYASSFWEAARYVDYWAGWPADFPALANSSPAGYVNTIHVSWAYDWSTASAMFQSGDCDFIDVPRNHIAELYANSTGPYRPPNYPLAGIRCFNPLPTPAADALFFTFNINLFSPYGPINPPGVFNETAIPSDFFGNPDWGIYVRKAFAQAFDYNNFTSTVASGEATHPATAIIPGLSYHDPTVIGYSYDLAAANASFNQVPGLATTGFTITIVYRVTSMPNTADRVAALLLKTAIESLNPRYHVNAQMESGYRFLLLVIEHANPIFLMGWLADFPDAHDFAEPFYASRGYYPQCQLYSNATMDALVSQGIATPDGPARQAVYTAVQKLAIADCPHFILAQPTGRHFERDWVQGWYYNPSYPSVYFYNLWKWYYVPASLQDASTPPAGYNEPADINHDGKVDVKDIRAVARAFGATYGPPVEPRWIFTADVNLDRKIDIKDVTYIVRLFGKTSSPWAPS